MINNKYIKKITTALVISSLSLLSVNSVFADDESIDIINVTSITNETDTVSEEAAITSTTIQEFNAQSLSNDINIGTILDPSDVTQFSNTVTQYDGTVIPVSSRDLRFLVDPSISSLEEARAKFKTEVPAATSDFNKSKMTYTKGGKSYNVSYWPETGKYYYSEYSMRDICEQNDMTKTGIRTTFKLEVTEPGSYTYYMILPDYKDVTRSKISQIKFTASDLSGPVVHTLSANWVDENRAAYSSNTYVAANSDGIDNSIKLEITATDNVTGYRDENKLAFQWYHDEILVDKATDNSLVLVPSNDNNGIYYCVITDGNGLSTTSDKIEIYNFDTTIPNASVKIYQPVTTLNGTNSYKTVGVEDTSLCTYEIIAIDYDDLHLVDEPIAITKNQEEIPDDNSNLWTHTDKFMITENGEYRIYAKDMAGNVYQSETIKATNIDPGIPTIKAILIEPEMNKKGVLNTYSTQQHDGSGAVVKDANGNAVTTQVPYMSVTVSAETNGSADGILYKLSLLTDEGSEINVSAKNRIDGYQSSPIFTGLTDDGNYLLSIKNSIGAVTTAKFNLQKEFYTASNGNSSYIARVLLEPMSWTNEEVILGVSFTQTSYVDEVQSISFDGGESWTKLTNNEARLIVPSTGTYEIWIKDTDGHIHKSGEQIVKNIDITPPELIVKIADNNKSFDIKATDDMSGLEMLSYTFKGENGKTSELTPINVFPITDDSTATYDMTFNMIGKGTYTFYLYDKAGNVCKSADGNTNGVSVVVGNVAIANELLKGSDNEVALKIKENISVDNTELTKDPVTIMFTTLDTSEFANNAYSWDEGVTFSDERILEVSQNGIYHLTIKDVYGNLYKSGDIEITNIDSVVPSITIEQQDNKLLVDTYDLETGITNISWKASGSEDIESLKNYDGLKSVTCTVTLPGNGAYTVYVTDKAGNVAEYTKTISNILTITNNEITDVEVLDTESFDGEVIVETDSEDDFLVTTEEATEEESSEVLDEEILDEMTTVVIEDEPVPLAISPTNYDDPVELVKENRTGLVILKIFLTLFVIAGLGAGGYFGYLNRYRLIPLVAKKKAPLSDEEREAAEEQFLSNVSFGEELAANDSEEITEKTTENGAETNIVNDDLDWF